MSFTVAIHIYVVKVWTKYWNFEQNIEHNKLKKELSKRNIGENKGKIDSSLVHGPQGKGASYTQLTCMD